MILELVPFKSTVLCSTVTSSVGFPIGPPCAGGLFQPAEICRKIPLERERNHFNEIARQSAASAALRMPEWNIRRYDKPEETTPYPLEYAYHLLGDLKGQKVLALGCGEGLDVVILGALGASVTAIDISDESLRLGAERARANGVEQNIRFVQGDAANLVGIPDGSIDKAHCIAILHHVDIPATIRELRRVLKPRGTAVFLEPLIGPASWQRLKKMIPRAPGVSEDEKPLSMTDVQLVNRILGQPGKQRRFGLTSRLAQRAGVRSPQALHKWHALDAWLIGRSRLASEFASPLVWSAIRT
jgi:SAM-dependent methyltransferase